jgi:hypothetical protein
MALRPTVRWMVASPTLGAEHGGGSAREPSPSAARRLPAMSQIPAGADVVGMLSALVGMQVPEEDAEGLVAALRNVLSASALLRELDLSGIEPVVTFDPRWVAPDTETERPVREGRPTG